MTAQDRLDGWKAIAGHLRRDERTAMRWAAERGLPVRRAPGPGRGSVYAFRSEIDDWLRSSEPKPGIAPPAAPVEPVPPITPAIPPTAPPPAPAARPKYQALVGASAAALIAIGAVAISGGRRHAPVATAAFTDPAAKAAYLQATYDWNLRTRASLLRATHEYAEAIGRNPGVAASYVGLANTYLLLREYGSLPDDEAYARAEAAAKVAVSLDPDSVEMHRTLAFLAFWWRGDRETARREFRSAIRLAPRDPLTHHWLATALCANGEHDAALKEIRIARELDPASTPILAHVGLIEYLAGHRAEGLATLRQVAGSQPDYAAVHRTLALIELYEGHGAAFVAEAATTDRLRGDAAMEQRTAQLAPIAQSGMPALTQALLARADAEAGHAASGYFALAQMNAVARRPDAAQAALATACHRHEIASVGAAGDLWLSLSLTPAQVEQACGAKPSLT